MKTSAQQEEERRKEKQKKAAKFKELTKKIFDKVNTITLQIFQTSLILFIILLVIYLIYSNSLLVRIIVQHYLLWLLFEF